MKIALSSCLAGNKVRYDGTDKYNETIMKLLKNHDVVYICPELISGFPVPHDPLEIKDNKVFTDKGIDVTEMLYKGSLKTYEMIKDCDLLILKSKSPSCGYKKIYDGHFNGTLIDGNGIFTQLCIDNNMDIYTENDIEILTKILG